MTTSDPDASGMTRALPPAGRLEYRPGWLGRTDADALFEVLSAEIAWQRRTIRMFGRVLDQPRRIAFQGDEGVVYRYSNDDYRADPWHPALRALRERLEAEIGTRFNSVLLNLYRDGRDSMGWHADDEAELGRDPTIASISLGAERRFQLRPKRSAARARQVEEKGGPGSERVSLLPAHGSLILMAGDLQHAWQHHLPRTARPVGPRINLTFRRILRPPA